MQRIKGVDNMNILVIGNGFDLAHDLPTRYGHFLEFCKRARRIYDFAEGSSCGMYEDKHLNDWEINREIKDALKNAFISRKLNRKYNEDGITYCNSCTTNNKFLDELYECIGTNAWLEYFLKRYSSMGENWIDFEMEISKAIQSLDELRIILVNGGSHQVLHKEKQEILMNLLKTLSGSLQKDFGNARAIENYAKVLNTELERLIRALEIYIVEFVGIISPIEKNSDICDLRPDYLLSFNYSDTYEKLYGDGKNIEYDYIHGKADINNTVESNNMVLGIDEYLEPDRMNKETTFIAFKKYYQRIYKGTGCIYKDWIEQIKRDAKDRSCEPVRHNLYIFGHSLDVTDKDILRVLILNDNVYTTIFYLDKTDLGKKIANLVKVIGQDELIRRTGGSANTIEFKLQQKRVDMDTQ